MDLSEIEKRNEEIGNEMRALIEAQGALTDEQAEKYKEEFSRLKTQIAGMEKSIGWLKWGGAFCLFWFVVICGYFAIKAAGIL